MHKPLPSEPHRLWLWLEGSAVQSSQVWLSHRASAETLSPPAQPSEIFSELSPLPVASASLGQVYKGRLRATGEQVGV